MKVYNPLKIFLGIFALVLYTSKTLAQTGNNKEYKHIKAVQNRQYNFMHFFPDKGLATVVAEKLNKQITDKVTVKELASIKGYLQVWPSQVSNLKGIGYLVFEG